MIFFFAWRYYKSKKNINAINIISRITVVAIAIVTAALILVLSVFNGFEDLVKQLYSDFCSNLKISAQQGKIITLTEAQIKQLKTLNSVKAFSFIVEDKAVLVNGELKAIVQMKGVDENYARINNIAQHIIRGGYRLGTVVAPILVVGCGIEQSLRLDVESSIYATTLYMHNRQAGKITSLTTGLNAYNAFAKGAFAIQQDFDNKYVITNLPFVQYMLGLQPNEYTSLEIATTNEDNIVPIKIAVQNFLGNAYKVETRYEQNKHLYAAMSIEKFIIYFIFCIIFIVAAFNISSTLTMLVLEKQTDIAVLQAMGASAGTIKKIFLATGCIIAGIGGVIGIVLASLICWLQLHFHLIPITGFVIDYYPVKIDYVDYLVVLATIIITTLLAAYLPSRKATLQLFSLKS